MVACYVEGAITYIEDDYEVPDMPLLKPYLQEIQQHTNKRQPFARLLTKLIELSVKVNTLWEGEEEPWRISLFSPSIEVRQSTVLNIQWGSRISRVGLSAKLFKVWQLSEVMWKPISNLPCSPEFFKPLKVFIATEKVIVVDEYFIVHQS